MTSIQIITQLLNGHHLNDKELEQAKRLLESLSKIVESRNK